MRLTFFAIFPCPVYVGKTDRSQPGLARSLRLNDLRREEERGIEIFTAVTSIHRALEIARRSAGAQKMNVTKRVNLLPGK